MLILPSEALLFSRIDDYYGVWAYEPDRFSKILSTLTTLNILNHLQTTEPTKPQEPYIIDKLITISSTSPPVDQAEGNAARGSFAVRLAVIPLHGTLMKHQSSLERSTSTVVARRQLRNLAHDPEIDGIMLHVDSPGGTVSGIGELDDAINYAKGKKPVHAYIEDWGASAAYRAASQASHISINQYGFAGSIGTYGVVIDSSKAHDERGVKVHVISTGKHKGVGVAGTPITEEHLAQYKTMIESMNEKFIAAVKHGRGFDPGELADGRMFDAKESIKHKLVDSVATFDEAIDRLAKVAKPGIKSIAKGSSQMAENEKVAASLAELKAICKKGSAEFVLSLLEKGVSKEEAKDAYIEHLDSQTTKRDTSAADLLKETVAKDQKAADSDFAEIVEANIEKGMERRAAIVAAAKTNPDLHIQWLANHPKNRGVMKRMMIQDRNVF